MNLQLPMESVPIPTKVLSSCVVDIACDKVRHCLATGRAGMLMQLAIFSAFEIVVFIIPG
jgi:hypothetical protein